MEPIWIENRLSWQLVAMVVATTLLIILADLAWRLWRGSTRQLAAVLIPVGIAWLAGVWTIAGRLLP